MATDVRKQRLQRTRLGIVVDTSKNLTFDPLQHRLVLIEPDPIVAASGGNTLWPKMTAQNKSSFWGPLN